MAYAILNPSMEEKGMPGIPPLTKERLSIDGFRKMKRPFFIL